MLTVESIKLLAKPARRHTDRTQLLSHDHLETGEFDKSHRYFLFIRPSSGVVSKDSRNKQEIAETLAAINLHGAATGPPGVES